jgi:hypothetical protein
MMNVRADLGIALRSLGRTPRMFACAVVCPAAAIGVATAVFAIVNGVVIRRLVGRAILLDSIRPSLFPVARGRGSSEA